MAAVVLNGFIDNIHYLPTGTVLIQISEFRKGYKYKDGRKMDDKYVTWRVIFKQGLRKYINDHFSERMYVEIKGDIIPFKMDGNTAVEGYTLVGQTLNMGSLPNLRMKLEQKMVKESQLHDIGAPNLEDFQTSDF